MCSKSRRVYEINEINAIVTLERSTCEYAQICKIPNYHGITYRIGLNIQQPAGDGMEVNIYYL